jgi:hypothetical protein
VVVGCLAAETETGEGVGGRDRRKHSCDACGPHGGLGDKTRCKGSALGPPSGYLGGCRNRVGHEVKRWIAIH